MSGVPFLRGVPYIVNCLPCLFDKAGVSHNLGLSGILVSTSWHRVDILLAMD